MLKTSDASYEGQGLSNLNRGPETFLSEIGRKDVFVLLNRQGSILKPIGWPFELKNIEISLNPFEISGAPIE